MSDTARRSRLFVAAALAAVCGGRFPGTPQLAAAQSYFGQNQPQYDRLDWEILGTEHFLIYFYPAERAAAIDAGRMAERSYARLTRLLNHEFSEKKSIMLFASRTDFGQNNVTGDLGEGTGGVTEALRHRMLLNFTGDLRSFEHVLTHEMVHAFQYDVYARGKAGSGLRTLQQFPLSLWFAEGMAEYLSLGPISTLTEIWMRDAALHGKVPSIREMTVEPQKYFPYRFGHSFWAYVGRRYGDEVIGRIMNAVPNVGTEAAFKREIGTSLDEIGDDWRADLRMRLLPPIGGKEYIKTIAQPLLTKKRSGGEIFLAPALSNDGKRVAFLSNGSFVRGQVFIDLWLADAASGKRIDRLVPSTTNPTFEELRILYAQSAFSPDDSLIAFTAQRAGKDVLYIKDVKTLKTVKRLDLPLESAIGPSWSPDGKRLVFSGSEGGITDLYIVTIADGSLRRLTNDAFGDLQPQWSPDGMTIAFVTDRGPEARLDVLYVPRMRIALYSLADSAITVIPGQAGFNINPQWAPDGRSLAYLSDRTGDVNLFLYELGGTEQYQLTNLIGAISGITEHSPAISWARTADRLAFTYYEDGEYTIWAINTPRALKRGPFRAPVVAAVPDSVLARSGVAVARAPGSVFRLPADSLAAPDSTRPSVSVVALLDSIEIGLPDPAKFTFERSRVRFQPDYVARPSIGYAPDAYGRNVFGGTTVVMSDMLGNHHLSLAGELNGRFSESRLFAGYTNLSRRLQYSGAISQSPYYILSSDSLTPTPDPTILREHQEITIYIQRQLFGVASYPFNRFSRVEVRGGYNNVARRRWFLNREVQTNATPAAFEADSIRPDPTLNYFDARAAYVSDNTLFGYTGPIMGRRYRFQLSPVVGSFRWIETLADYRRYDPLIFNYLTLATRLYANLAVGPNETAFPKYIARPDFVRGYDRNNSFYLSCPVLGANPGNCSQVELLGSRVLVGNVELRFPLIQRFELGLLPVALPPLDGLVFYDAGVAWSRDQTLYAKRPANFNVAAQRYPLKSYGVGLRLNLFNYAILRWDYAKPLDHPNRRGFWTWSLWPSY